MEKQEVIDLMRSSKNSDEWNRNCDIVKKAHGNSYPDYWYETFIASGMINELLNDPTANKIKIVFPKRTENGDFDFEYEP